MSKQLHYNNKKLAKLILRRDRIRIPVWLISILAMTWIIPPTFVDMYRSAAERQIMAETMKNPAMIAMVGPGYGFDNYTIGAMMGNMMLLFTIVAVAMMNIFFVVRHTRKDEEGGRIEMIRSLSVGRLSNLSATMLVAVGINIILALLSGIGLYALGIESMDFQGSMLYGVSLGVSGILFAAIAALFVQLCTTARGAMTYSFAFLGVAYLLRATGDVSSEILACISPLGLILRTEVYVNNDWWPALVLILLSIIVTAVAFYLNSIRDLGEGFIPARPGRKTASHFLQSPIGLAFRLLKTTLIGWAIGMFILGASYGSVLGDLEGFLANNEMFKQMLASGGDFSMTEQFIGMLMSVISICATVPILLAILKLKTEENRHRSEALFARAVSRTRLMSGYLIISFLSSLLMNFFAALGMWAAAASVMEQPISFKTLFLASMVYLPAIWVMIGVAVFLIGFYPKGAGITWIYLGVSLFVVYFGKILQLPDWLAKTSPYGNIPAYPVEEIEPLKLIVLSILAIVFTVAGYVGYCRRDIQG